MPYVKIIRFWQYQGGIAHIHIPTSVLFFLYSKADLAVALGYHVATRVRTSLKRQARIRTRTGYSEGLHSFPQSHHGSTKIPSLAVSKVFPPESTCLARARARTRTHTQFAVSMQGSTVQVT